MPKEIAKFLNMPDHYTCTGHSFRRSSTIILANTGVGIEDLKRHGLWKSNSTCEGYIQGSLAYKHKMTHKISDAINLPSTSKKNLTQSAESYDAANENQPKRISTSAPSMSKKNVAECYDTTEGNPPTSAASMGKKMVAESAECYDTAEENPPKRMDTSAPIGESTSPIQVSGCDTTFSQVLKNSGIQGNKPNIIFHFGQNCSDVSIHFK